MERVMSNNHQLALTAARGRLLGMEMVYRAASGHIGGSLSAMEIVTLLYQEVLRIDPANPADPARDRFVLSKGHCTPALYPNLAFRGFFPEEELKMFRRIDGTMSGHAEMHIPGVDMSTGSLGQGISAAVGMALAGKADKKDYRVYTLLGDGEIEEGQVWEAAMFAGNHGLDNLVLVVDHNGLQIDGTIEEVNSAMPIADKFRAFKFHVIELANGNDMAQVRAAFEEARSVKDQPVCIVAETVKGKGVSFMENQVDWHGKGPNDEQYEQAMAELAKEA